MSNINFLQFFIMISSVIGFFAIILNWMFIIDGVTGDDALDEDMYKKNMWFLFVLSLIMLLISWITSDGSKDGMITSSYIFLMAWWAFSGFVSLVLSLIRKINRNFRSDLLRNFMGCLVRGIIILLIVAVVY